eukprot:5280030-Amphidinium_carterae.1
MCNQVSQAVPHKSTGKLAHHYLATAAKLMGLDVETSKGAATPITPESMRLKDETQEVSAEEKKL